MRIVSFDAFRSLGIPGVTYIKPDYFQKHLDMLSQSDWVLFPEYWQVNALRYGLNVRVFPSMASYHIGHSKIEQTRVLQCICPHNIPKTLILENTDSNRDYVWQEMDIPFVVKIPISSEGRGVFLIDTIQQWRDYCSQQPVLYAQEYLPINRDMRIVVIGKNIIGGYWRLQSGNGFYNNIAQGGSVHVAPLPDAAIDLVQRIALRLDINHGGFDVAMLGNHPYILEFNRLFGNQGLSKQGIKPSDHIYEYLRDESGPYLSPMIDCV
jgi:ribosomal protein S6--L-glutamate ligase